ncbi:uncharacterized protein BO87DRAFT_400563 [Aspergillus neoniger CBS 115656]|uniref:Uncharacterized protein n=1 Tax=Aspergillus neoniger (strain CBS 115656) TaxID=1448310 RepID=A0A318Y8P6_ASPNB|nr:hypothetical protein BO87DRAFT_400563 [Aspergillus neoniger CBS 115656]PYH30319.1 hypothetical protein BO87DRAFT_400563 [Aspergillus neoniger CBS 115656]
MSLDVCSLIREIGCCLWFTIKVRGNESCRGIPDPKGQTCAAEALQYLRHETYKSSRRKETGALRIRHVCAYR